MPQYTIQAPDGRSVTVEGDSPPTESDLDQIFASLPERQAAPEQNLTSPENLARYAAAAGGGGFVTNPRLTSGEQLKGIAGNAAIAASMIAPEALIAMAPELAPAAAASTPGWLARLGLAGAVGGGAGESVLKLPEVISGETTPLEAAKEIGKQTLLGGTLGPLAGVAGQKLLQTAVGGIGGLLGERFTTIPNAAAAVRRGATEGLVRPLFESPVSAETRQAAGLIESVAGEKPPQSIGEALGNRLGGGTYAELEHQLGSQASGAIPIDTRNQIARRVLHTAALLRGTGASSSEIADRTVTALEKEIGENISGPAKDAIRKISEGVDTALEDALKATTGEGFALTTPAAETSPYFAGNIGKMAEAEAQQAFKETEDALFGRYRELLGKNAPPATLSNTSKAVDQILGGGLKTTNEAGETIPIASTIQDADARKFLGQLQQAVSTPQDIESLRLFRSQVGESIGQPGVLSGLPNAAKKRIYAALSSDIEAAINKIPDKRVKEALQSANAFRKENIDKFLLPSSERAGMEVEQGGTTGQSLFRSILSDADKYNTFRSVLGDRFNVFRDAARDAILTEAQAVAPGKTFSVGDALERINKLPKEIQADMFPQVDRLRQLAARELKVIGLLKDVPEDAKKSLGWMKANLGDLKEFIGPEGEQQFLDAVRLQAAEQQRFNNAVIRDVANESSNTISKNPNQFLTSILDGTLYSKPGDVKHALDVVGRHSPRTLHDIQVEYLTRMIENSKVQGIVSGEELAKKLATPVGGPSPTSGGPKLSLSNEILGKPKTDSIRMIADALGKTQKNLLGREIQHRSSIFELIAASDSPTDIATMLASGPLNNRSRGLIKSLFIETPTRMKYHLASTLLNDPKLLPLLSKPVDSLSGAEAAEIASAISLDNRR